MTDETPKETFPAWLRELCYFGGLIVMLAAFLLNQKSDIRSAREELNRMSQDMAAIRQSLPNKEVYDLKLAEITGKIADLRQDLGTVEKSMENQTAINLRMLAHLEASASKKGI